MASLRDKMWDLMRQIQNDLKNAVVKGETTEQYADYKEAFEVLRRTERLTKAVRSHIRARMRKTLAAVQESCPHAVKEDTVVRNRFDADLNDFKRVVEGQRCTACDKRFDLREKVN